MQCLVSPSIVRSFIRSMVETDTVRMLRTSILEDITKDGR